MNVCSKFLLAITVVCLEFTTAISYPQLIGVLSEGHLWLGSSQFEI